MKNEALVELGKENISIPDLSEQYKQFEAAHGKEIEDALAKDFGAIGIHCQQLMDKYK